MHKITIKDGSGDLPAGTSESSKTSSTAIAADDSSISQSQADVNTKTENNSEATEENISNNADFIAQKKVLTEEYEKKKAELADKNAFFSKTHKACMTKSKA